MMGDAMQLGEGERLETSRRRKFWRALGGIMIVGMIVGGAAGFFAATEGVPPDQAWTMMPDWLAVAIIGAGLIAFNIGCWAFMRSIDEVELADNLWASTVSYYVYAMLFPTWWALAKAGVTTEPNHWLIFAISLGSGMGFYLWRKVRAG